MSAKYLSTQLSFESLEQRRVLTNNWGLDAIDAPEVWAQGYTGEGVVVAVIDAGIELHPDLTPNIWANPGERVNSIDDDGNGYVDDMNGWDFAEGDNLPLSQHRHGNHVFGVIGATNDGVGATGVAYDAKIMPLRVFDDSGASSSRHISDAIRFAVDNGADVINLSLDSVATRNVDAALSYAGTRGVLVVASSGNRSDTSPSFPATASAGLDNVISVGAHDQNYELWSGSNRVGVSGAIQVDAPGVGIYSASTGNTYGVSSGTSSAAAHVAGIAALALSANPALTPIELRNAIVKGATDQVRGSDSIGGVSALRTVNLVTTASATASIIKKDTVFASDFDGDGEVGFQDFMSLARNFGNRVDDHSQGDANGNGEVDFRDFLLFAMEYEISLNARAARSGIDRSVLAQDFHQWTVDEAFAQLVANDGVDSGDDSEVASDA